MASISSAVVMEFGCGEWKTANKWQQWQRTSGVSRCLRTADAIAAGKYGEMLIWDAKTFEQVFSRREEGKYILGVDFSPDSTRLVTASQNRTATVWDVATRELVQTLHHEDIVIAVKYSPQGDRIATATLDGPVRVWDGNDGRLLVDIPVKVTPQFNTGLLWSNNHLFVVSGSAIKQLEASTGSAVSEWLVPDADNWSCIALSKHAGFIAYSGHELDSTVTFWDTSTHIQLGLIQHTRPVRSIAFSPDDRFLAIGGKDGKITIRSLSRITVSTVFLWIMAHLNNLCRSSFRIGSNPCVPSSSHVPGS